MEYGQVLEYAAVDVFLMLGQFMNFQARHFTTNTPIEIEIVKETIHSIRETSSTENLPFVAPGLFDLQINGFGGIWFSDENLTVDQTLETLHAHFAHGIIHLFPTLITNSAEALEHGFSVIRQACERERWADRMVLGCHLEGPYISPEDGPRGAHPLEHVRSCDWNEFQKLQAASGNRIRLLTLAPEQGNAVDFIRQAVRNGVVIALGHTAADSEQIAAAVDAGARLSTHLGNGSHGTIRRHPNYIWDQLGDRRLWASIITDGHHLPPSVVRSIYFAKGIERTIITCDASGLAGLPPGEYDYHGGRFEILESGRIVVAGQREYLAGSGSQTEYCIAQMIEMTGCSLAEAWRMATVNPAQLLGVECSRLECGAPANLTFFEHDPQNAKLTVLRTIADGELVYSRDRNVNP